MTNHNSNTRTPATIDARGFSCPIPVIKMEAALRELEFGEKLLVISDDPIAVIDIPHFCSEGGHKAIRLADRQGACVFQVTAGPKTAPKTA